MMEVARVDNLTVLHCRVIEGFNEKQTNKNK